MIPRPEHHSRFQTLLQLSLLLDSALPLTAVEKDKVVADNDGVAKTLRPAGWIRRVTTPK